MNESRESSPHDSVDALRQIDRICDEFEAAWTEDAVQQLDQWLQRLPPTVRSAGLRELLRVELDKRWSRGEAHVVDELANRFPECRLFLHTLLSQLAVGSESDWARTGVSAPGEDDSTHAVDDPWPTTIGRFQIIDVLGTGGFGRVYRALDSKLGREVAIKGLLRPPGRHVDKREAERMVNMFLEEARKVAGLKHTGLATVYEFFVERGRPFIVQELIDGCDLRQWVLQRQSDARTIVTLIRDIAVVLQYAHSQSLIHRDLKPSNVLVDDRGHAYVMDFGLALHERVQWQRRGDCSGTLEYMPPEQVRGEAHRMDGRSDLWSLGVIFYELLTGKRPFNGTREELRDRIQFVDPRPLRERNPTVPAALEQICLKLLQRRQTDRYRSAADLIDDLNDWLEKPPADSEPAASAPDPLSDAPAFPIRVVPRGLRSFDEADSESFVELLPGPRYGDGLPESIRFWKRKIDERASDQTFGVGLLYGPSGCGKSSLMKAGVLPRLAKHVRPVYVEATASDTEARLLAGLQRVCPELPRDSSLTDAIGQLRGNPGDSRGYKVVVIIDQFEQWLHARVDYAAAELTRALRQCDGGNVQAIAMVRTDFWMAVIRMFRELEVPLTEGHNSAVLDLFDLLHARKVLTEFGRAYGRLPDNRLPDNLGQLTAEQEQFLDESIAGLSTDGKVISVRLTLFADMVKGRPWTLETLREVGGTSGIGVTFLEETFCGRTAPPENRYHENSARDLLAALLPETGSEIKGHRRSRAELLAATDYATRPDDFERLLQLLDRDLRLITPVDSAGTAANRRHVAADHLTADHHPPGLSADDNPGESYELTHDYLVPSLRTWLNDGQDETWRRRAERTLAERTAAWTAQPYARNLPTLLEFGMIRLLTNKSKWTQTQARLMSQSARRFVVRAVIAATAVIALVAIGMNRQMRLHREQQATLVRDLVDDLLKVEPAQIPAIARAIEANSVLADPHLRALLAKPLVTREDRRARLRARLASVGRDRSHLVPLTDELLVGDVQDVPVILTQLQPYADELRGTWRNRLRDSSLHESRRFRAALALVHQHTDSSHDGWTDHDLTLIAKQLTASNPEFHPLLRDLLRPLQKQLITPLERVFSDGAATAPQRLSAARALADYAANDDDKLAQLLTRSNDEQFAVLYPLVQAASSDKPVRLLSEVARTLPPEGLSSADRVVYGQTRANAALALLRLGQRADSLAAFRTVDDPEALAQFVFACRSRGVEINDLLDCLQMVSERRDHDAIDARYALLLTLGEYELEEVPPDRRAALLKQLADGYRNDPSAAVHGATRWLLTQWGQHQQVREVDETPVPYSPEREWFTWSISVPSAHRDGARSGQASQTPPMDRQTFYYTFVVFPAGDYWAGSVLDEQDRSDDERRHLVRITRSFALLDREITFAELIAFSEEFANRMENPSTFATQPQNAGFSVEWYDAVDFCRWLGLHAGWSESEQPYAAPDGLDRKEYERVRGLRTQWVPQDWPVELARPGFRLPTEAEWEIAVRNQARTAYSFGSDARLLDRFGWFRDNSGKRMHAPRLLRPSRRGLFDVHGNACEWTHDWKGEYGTELAVDPQGPERGRNRVRRGGSWEDDDADCRAAFRSNRVPTHRPYDGGFRIAVGMPERLPNPAPLIPGLRPRR